MAETAPRLTLGKPGVRRSSDGSRGARSRSSRTVFATVICVVCALAAAVAGCGGSGGSDEKSFDPAQQPAASSKSVPSVDWGLVGSARVLNHWLAITGNLYVLSNAMGALLAFDGQGHLEPNLATKWTKVDELTYTFEIRPDARFSNGQPVTMKDVVASLNRTLDPATGGVASAYFATVKSIEQTAKWQLTVRLKVPDPTWPHNAAAYPSWVLPASQIAGEAKGLGSPSNLPIGIGAYRLTEFVPDEKATLERNPYYFGEKPKVQRVVVRFLKDDASRLAAIQSGEIDGTFDVAVTPQWERLSSVRLLSTPSLSFPSIIFNVTKPPFDDVHVRRMFAYAWNREQIVKSVLNDNAEVAQTIDAPWTWVNLGLDEDEVRDRYAEEIPQYPFDLDKAKAELAKSSVPSGFKASLEYPLSEPDFGNALQVLAEDLKKIGVNLKLREVSDAQYLEDAFSRQLPAVPFGAAGDYAEPAQMPLQVFHSDQANPQGLNFSDYRSKQMDQLLEGAATGTNEERVPAIMDALALSMSDLPILPGWWDNDVTAIDTDLVINDLGPLNLYNWASRIAAAEE